MSLLGSTTSGLERAVVGLGKTSSMSLQVNGVDLESGGNKNVNVGGSGGGGEPTDSEMETSDSKGEEEYEEYEQMAYPNLEWMSQ